jgi:hypothetical protein
MSYLIQYQDDNFPYYCKSIKEVSLKESEAKVFATKKQAQDYLYSINKVPKLAAAQPTILQV